MPNVLPTIPNDPPQGIQALLDKVYLWNPDVSNELIGKINELLEKFDDVSGAIKPYGMLTAPVMQYVPCYYGSGVYVAARELNEIPMEFNEADWILIATKGVTAEEVAETYLPLSGGTLTGTLRTMSVIPSKSGPDYALGSDLYKWQRIYVRQISNSSTITVPTKSGTMARLEDLTGDNVSVTFAGQDDTVQNAINTLKTDQDELGDQVSAIESKIPADASETNQLVTKNEVLALPTFTYMVVNELPETGEEKIIYLVPKAGEGNDVHDEYIWVNGGYELIGTTAVDLSGYLPLSGGTLTGKLEMIANNASFSIVSKQTSWGVSQSGGNLYALQDGLQIYAVTADGGLRGDYRFLSDGFSAGSGIPLGSSARPWAKVFTLALNNGADIAVPTTGGTIALKEDIAESVTTKDLTVGTDEGTLNIGITAGVATIATNNGLDIVSQTKFDTAPTTDDATAWADVNATALVTKAQVTAALSTAGGGANITIRNWA